MNFGVTMLGLLMIVGSLALVLTASANAPFNYVDSYNTPQSNVVNATQGVIINGTGTIGNLGGGAGILFACTGVVVVLVGLISGTTRKQRSAR